MPFYLYRDPNLVKERPETKNMLFSTMADDSSSWIPWLILNPPFEVVRPSLMHSHIVIDATRQWGKIFSNIFANSMCILPEPIVLLLKSLQLVSTCLRRLHHFHHTLGPSVVHSEPIDRGLMRLPCWSRRMMWRASSRVNRG